MRYLLDTSALLTHYRQEDGWQQVHALLEADEVDVYAASVSLTEFGRRVLDLGASADVVASALDGYELMLTAIVAIDVNIAHAAYDIGRATPQRLPLTDALIAAAARSRDAVLVHRDAHMRPIPAGLVRQLELVALPDP
jgi:predicted nucleic acid-binding protein